MAGLTPHSPDSRAWQVVGFLAAAFLINYIDRQVVFSIFPVLRRELSFTDAQLGLAGSLFTWTYSLAMPVTGRLADLFRRDRMIVAALALWSVATLGTGLSGNLAQFLFWRVMMGITEALYIPPAIALITQAHPGPTRSRALSLHGLAQFTGITLGGWYGGWSADHIGWRSGFAVLAAIGISYAVFLARKFPSFDPPRAAATDRSSPAELVASRCWLVLAAAFFAFCGMLWMLYAWLPSVVYEKYGLTLAESGLTATLYLQASSAVGVLLGGVAGDYFGKRHAAGRFLVVAGGLLGCAPFAWAAFQAPSLPLLKMDACGFGISAGFFVSNIFSASYDIVAPRNFGFSTGILNLIGGLSGGAAMLLGGLMKDSIGIGMLMGWAAAAAIGIALALSAVVHARLGRERRTPALAGSHG